MTRPHPLHKAIGDILGLMNFNNTGFIFDKACSLNSKQNIPLFIGDKKSNDTEICNPDALIIKDNKIKIIIEIEESSIKPTDICGKILTSILSDNYIKKDGKFIQFDVDTVFIQVVDLSKLAEKSKKPGQFKNLEKKIKTILPLGNISEYKLFEIKGISDKEGLINLENFIFKILK